MTENTSNAPETVQQKKLNEIAAGLINTLGQEKIVSTISPEAIGTNATLCRLSAEERVRGAEWRFKNEPTAGNKLLLETAQGNLMQAKLGFDLARGTNNDKDSFDGASRATAMAYDQAVNNGSTALDLYTAVHTQLPQSTSNF